MMKLPELKAILDHDKDEEGDCGNFQRVRKWEVVNPVEGIIIQYVTRTFAVFEVSTSKKMSGDELNTYVKHPDSSVHATENSYYELWRVGSDGKIVKDDGDEDVFGLCSIIPGDASTIKNSTKGSFTMTGEAAFYPSKTDAATLKSYGFTKGAVESANGLYSAFAKPTFPPHGSKPVKYEVTSTWDSTGVDEAESKITEK